MLKKSRIAVLAILVFSMLALYSFQLMQYQVVQGASYRTQASSTTTAKVDVIAPRGEILDRYGRVLASNSVGYSIQLERLIFPSNKHLPEQNTELLQLVGLLQKGGTSWEDDLPVSQSAPFKWNAGTTAKEIKFAVKQVNDSIQPKTKLPDNAAAQAVMDELTSYYRTEGYTLAQQRALAGIHYTMLEKGFALTNIYTLADNVNINTVTAIQERSTSLPGVTVQQVPVRSYSESAIPAAIVGMAGPIPQEDLAEYKAKGYSADAVVGRSGIEYYEENYLRGENGVDEVELNSNGDVASEPTHLSPAKPGDNVVLTIDSGLQQTVQDMLPVVIAQVKAAAASDPNRAGANARAAASVVLDIKTGEVLAMASYPTYSLDDYRKNYSALLSNPLTPLVFRATQGQYRPGSTFKPVVATAGLMNGVITKSTTWDLPATFTIGTGSGAWTGRDDEGSARVANVETALQVSSNIFFYKLGTETKIDPIVKVAQAFGLGQKTGIELSESAGKLSSPAEKQLDSGLPWYPADTAQASIGQLNTSVTPLQLANYVATLVKGGTQYQVHVVRQINNADNTKVLVNNTKPTVKSKFSVPQSVVDTVKEGMLKVTQQGGTAYSVFAGFGMQVGGKTGTAQVHANTSGLFYTDYNGVFICFAPYDDPELAIATVVEYGHNGYQVAPVAKTAIQQYFGLDASGNQVAATCAAQPVDTLLP